MLTKAFLGFVFKEGFSDAGLISGASLITGASLRTCVSLMTGVSPIMDRESTDGSSLISGLRTGGRTGVFFLK